MSIGQRSRFHLLVHYAETSTCVISRNNGATSNTRVFVVGKRVPGTWSRVLDVLVLWTCSCCVDDVNTPDTRVGPWRGRHIPRHATEGRTGDAG